MGPPSTRLATKRKAVGVTPAAPPQRRVITKKPPDPQKTVKITSISATSMAKLKASALGDSATGENMDAASTAGVQMKDLFETAAVSCVPEALVDNATSENMDAASTTGGQMEDLESAAASCVPEAQEEPWQTVTNRGTMRRIAKAKLSVEELREKLRKSNKGLFKVVISKRVTTREADGSETVSSAPFEGGLLPLCSAIYKQFPFAKPESSFGIINVWTNAVEEASKVKKLDSLLGIPVTTRSSDLELVWTCICDVDLGFSEEDILNVLAEKGVKAVRRETCKRLINGSPTIFPTNRVLYAEVDFAAACEAVQGLPCVGSSPAGRLGP